jgi:hypothetical protein
VLEAKKIKANGAGKGFDDAMQRARGQAEQPTPAPCRPRRDGRPSSSWWMSATSSSCMPSSPAPAPPTRLSPIRARTASASPICATRPSASGCAALWLDPLSLDPTRATARVTREVAERLAEVAKALESAGHDAETVAGFLSRCLFTMFAEDVELLPRRDGKGAFTLLLESLKDDPAQFVPLVGELWRAMDTGEFSVAIRAALPRFNGKLFKTPQVLPLTRDQIGLLIKASRADWTQVEPAIFGTLLERALDPTERHASSAPTTRRAPTSSGWCCLPSSSRCARAGATSRPPR